MAYLDLKKVPLPPANRRHSQHQEYLGFVARQIERLLWIRKTWFMAFVALAGGLSFFALYDIDEHYLRWTYREHSTVQEIRVRTLSRFASLPVQKGDPKEQILAQYLAEKQSPLTDYAGLISRMPHWKLLVAIAQAESNLCKKTQRNNCWGIGPGTPLTYEDIAQGLYHASYLLSKFDQMGMKKPETLVHTYVGYYNPSWIRAVNDVFYELQERGLQ
ncbi:MAG: hypothetical protein HY397_02965 [Candidatus Doudnabacteria bacterium]|nr:hypothetical protein [Candidatus Doudnabacteria bacterium]